MGKTILWLYILAIAMGLLACEKKAATTEAANPSTETATADPQKPDAGEPVLAFLKWYDQNEMALSTV